MTSIQVIIPDHIPLGEYKEWKSPDGKYSGTQWVANPEAVKWAADYILQQLYAYGLSECLGSYDPTEVKPVVEKK